MRILATLTAAAILSSCSAVADQPALVSVLDPLMTNHAAALGGDDVAQMRRTGRILISIYDASTFRRTN
jgi:hypothetical protein